ncbi:MAG TPA: NAD(P)-dependent oxidoreductase [Solirubrobacteraceae bacterium]|jgi:3-hydroxyisobutyrate dehydrogenase
MIVTVLGTGTMGAPMARNICGRAFGDVRVWNRTTEKAESLADCGCTVAESVADAVKGAGAVLVMLADDAAVLSVLEEALPAMEDGAILVQASTVGVKTTEQIAARAAEHDIPFLDAPVVGTKQPAEKGNLVVLASGPDDAIDACGAIFDAIALKTVRAGEAGAGTRLKLTVNTWILGLVESLAETVALAQKLGVDPGLFFQTIGGGPLDTKYAHTKGALMTERSFEPASFSLALARKDAGLVLDAAAEADLALPIIEAVAKQMGTAIDAGHGDEDMAATYLASCPEP